MLLPLAYEVLFVPEFIFHGHKCDLFAFLFCVILRLK